MKLSVIAFLISTAFGANLRLTQDATIPVLVANQSLVDFTPVLYSPNNALPVQYPLTQYPVTAVPVTYMRKEKVSTTDYKKELAALKKELFGNENYDLSDIKNNNKAYDPKWLMAQLKISRCLELQEAIERDAAATRKAKNNGEEKTVNKSSEKETKKGVEAAGSDTGNQTNEPNTTAPQKKSTKEPNNTKANDGEKKESKSSSTNL